MAINIVRKDWFEHRKFIFLATAGMFLPLFVAGNNADLARGMMSGILIGGAYSYSHFCFFIERQRGTLQLLLSLPVRPLQIALAKYASLYSMCLFTALVPGAFFADFRTLYLVTSLVLFLSTACMACTVVSDKPWAPMIPFWFVLVFFMPVQRILTKYYPDGLGIYVFVTTHITLLAGLALILSPAIAFLSALHFQKESVG